MEKLKQYKYIILIALVVLGLHFYWYQIRPARIMHDCSWVKVTAPVQSDTKLSAIEQKAENRYADLIPPTTIPRIEPGSLYEKFLQEKSGQSGERVGFRRASKEQYDFCLHDKGLK